MSWIGSEIIFDNLRFNDIGIYGIDLVCWAYDSNICNILNSKISLIDMNALH